ncbi:MAG TPA: MFS transporter [Terriglobia bacterium]|nr:MFS transporter [Terriglobia bacterium]
MAEKQSSRVRWLLVIWMFVVSAIAYLDRVNISIAGHTIMEQYHLSNVELGWIFSAFVVGYAIFQTPGGSLADHMGPRWVLAAGVLWWGVFTSLTAMVPTGIASALFIFIALRFMLGAGEAVVYPASNNVVANWVPTQERGIANGLIFAGVGVGAGITPPFITYILTHFGWRWSFWGSALLGIAAGIVWFLIARDSPERHPWVSKSERELIRAGVDVKHEQHVASTPWRKIVRSKEILAITFSYFCYGYVAYIFFTWFFIYLTTVRGLDLKSGAGYTMLPFIAMAVCSPVGGIICDAVTRRYGKRWGRCGIAVVGIGLAAAFIVVGAEAASPEVASFVLAGGVGALYLSQSSFWSVSADVAGPWAGTVSGAMNTGGQIGGALTASLTPAIANHFGWSASFLTAAALCAVGSVAWLMVDPNRKIMPPRGFAPTAKARARA